MAKQQKILPLIPDSYLAVIRNSIGSELFRSLYARVGGRRVDIMRDGKLSCAFYVSAILTLFKLIKSVHGTVDSTVKDLRDSGWSVIRRPKVGSVIVWERVNFGHRHIGFYVGGGKAVSTSSTRGYPIQHHWVFPKRKVEFIFWNRKLAVLDRSRSRYDH